VSAPGRARVFAAVLFGAVGALIRPFPCEAQIGAANARMLLWTAPGNDGNVGRAARYEIHYSTVPISEAADSATFSAWWSSNSSVVPASRTPTPSSAGQADSVLVPNLSYGSTYYFILRTQDNAQNWSYFSNVAMTILPACSAPGSIPDQPHVAYDVGKVRVSWSGNDALATQVQIYRGRTPGLLALLATLPASEQSFDDETVSPGVTYYYAVAWAADCGNGALGSPLAINVPRTSSTSTVGASHSIRAFPNPSKGPVRFVVDVQGGAPQTVHIWLYDLNGHRLARLAEGAFPAGETSFTWQRVSWSGDPVAPGYYEALGTIGGSRVRERLVLLP
jgi:hypothetical protein